MTSLRLAELREGTWLRPANLTRERPALVTAQCTFFTGQPESPDLAERLWDLPAWAARARELAAALDEAADLSAQFTLAAAVLRHFLADPLLPQELLPPDWPGTDLRTRYDDFDTRFQSVLRTHLGI
jgi:phenylacetic acid degradation operon negative regulatory protein